MKLRRLLRVSPRAYDLAQRRSAKRRTTWLEQIIANLAGEQKSDTKKRNP